jgi:hypothetical protein
VNFSKRDSSPKRAESANSDKKNGNSKWCITFNFVQFESEAKREKSYNLWADSWFHIKDVKDN